VLIVSGLSRFRGLSGYSLQVRSGGLIPPVPKAISPNGVDELPDEPDKAPEAGYRGLDQRAHQEFGHLHRAFPRRDGSYDLSYGQRTLHGQQPRLDATWVPH
jgi:hypothetical protein